MLLKAGPALSVEQFKHYQPTTTLGLSLTMTAPNRTVAAPGLHWAYSQNIYLWAATFANLRLIESVAYGQRRIRVFGQAAIVDCEVAHFP
jgi:hypothetical protein